MLYPEGKSCPICGMLYASGGQHECHKPVDTDEVNHPDHYTRGGIECLDAIESALTPEEFRGYIKGNILKYTWREKLKNKDQDLKKAEFYLKKLLGSK